jgi:hypothetical protein
MLETPLYARSTHSLARVIVVCMVTLIGLGLLAGSTDFMSQPTFGGFAGILALILVVIAFARTMLRTQPIFGTPDGLIVRARGQSRTIPWSHVGDVAYPTTSFNPVLRSYYVELRDTGERVYFFAHRGELLQIRRLRLQSYRAGNDTTTTE